MTDKEWEEMREKRRKLCKDGNLKCGPNMIPYTIGRDGVPWTWYSRRWVEQAQAICNDPKFQKSVAIAKKALMPG